MKAKSRYFGRDHEGRCRARYPEDIRAAPGRRSRVAAIYGKNPAKTRETYSQGYFSGAISGLGWVKKKQEYVRWFALKLPRQKAFTPRKRGRGARATNQYFQGFGRRQQKTRQSAGLHIPHSSWRSSAFAADVFDLAVLIAGPAMAGQHGAKKVLRGLRSEERRVG